MSERKEEMTVSENGRKQTLQSSQTHPPGNSLQMTYVMLRLNRWRVYVRWLTSNGVGDPMPAQVQSWFGLLMMDRVQQSGKVSVQSSCPVDIEEARETQRCVLALREHMEYLYVTVIEDYLVGGTQEQKADALGIEVRAFRNRRDAMHAKMLELFVLASADLPLTCGRRRGPGRPPTLCAA